MVLQVILNISMCTALDANLQYEENFFTISCYVFYDFCHMIKLVRSTLGDKQILRASSGERIE